MSFAAPTTAASAPPGSATKSGNAGVELLDPRVMDRIGHLEIIAARIVEGTIAGQHRSPFKGGSIEFSEHRHYSPGDELRMLDWRAVARSDRYYIKQFEQETNLHATLILDASGSMAYGSSTVTKFRYAQMAAACLARLMLDQRDAVGVAVVDIELRAWVPPRNRSGHLATLLETLQNAKPAGDTSLAKCLDALAYRSHRRGLIVLLSDAFDQVGPLITALHQLRKRGNEVLLFHILAPEELTFPFHEWSRFQCLEVTGRELQVDPATLRKHYLERIGKFVQELRLGCGQVGVDFVPLRTDEPLGTALEVYLHRRAAGSAGHARR